VPYQNPVDSELLEALDTIEHFVAQTTGQGATSVEIAHALKRYFVLNEIKEHIEMEREEDADES
jgi:hypothetical protein